MVFEHHRRHVRLIAALALVLATSAHAATVPPGEVAVRSDEIAQPLTDDTPNPRRGLAVAGNTTMGNCLVCHAIPIPTAPGSGDLGPSLAGVGARLSAGQMRLRIVDAKRLNPATIMPAYYRIDGLNRVGAKYLGQTMLSAQDIEDLIAYLQTLKSD